MQFEKHYEMSLNGEGNMNKKQFTLAIVFAITIGMIFVVVGSIMLYFNYRQGQRCTDSVSAVIVDADMSTYTDNDGSRSKAYYPTYQYTYNRKEYEVTSSDGVGPRNPYTIGDTVVLKVNPDDPTEFISNKPSSKLFIGIIFVCVGAINAIIFAICGFKIGNKIKGGTNYAGYES